MNDYYALPLDVQAAATDEAETKRFFDELLSVRHAEILNADNQDGNFIREAFLPQVSAADIAHDTARLRLRNAICNAALTREDARAMWRIVESTHHST
jgi:hypothetical protein